jgi:hypothetical protein
VKVGSGKKIRMKIMKEIDDKTLPCADKHVSTTQHFCALRQQFGFLPPSLSKFCLAFLLLQLACLLACFLLCWFMTLLVRQPEATLV